mmetsp:Transcript_35834/g.90525  ORF Transcript_35834/g.90525 Transcript_35834/m.90525 type:complete len:228 (+) Transcript_35834:2242-2925(+)
MYAGTATPSASSSMPVLPAGRSLSISFLVVLPLLVAPVVAVAALLAPTARLPAVARCDARMTTFSITISLPAAAAARCAELGSAPGVPIAHELFSEVADVRVEGVASTSNTSDRLCPAAASRSVLVSLFHAPLMYMIFHPGCVRSSSATQWSKQSTARLSCEYASASCALSAVLSCSAMSFSMWRTTISARLPRMVAWPASNSRGLVSAKHSVPSLWPFDAMSGAPQ